MTMLNGYTFYVGRIISQSDSITIWHHLFVFYSAGNEVTGSLNLHEKPLTTPFTLAMMRDFRYMLLDEMHRKEKYAPIY